MRTPPVALLLVLAVAACDQAHDDAVFSRSEPAVTTTVLLPRGQSWKVYPYGSRTECCTDWIDATAPFGYGESYVHPIPYGSDAAHKPITVTALMQFWVDDPARVYNLHLDAMYDDGFVYYVNGIEVGRASMPAGPVTPTTLALGHEAENTYVRFDAAAAVPRLTGGWNMLRVEIHQVSEASSDLVFDGSIVAELQDAPPPAPPDTLGGIPRASRWSYWDRGGDLGREWRDTEWSGSFSRGDAPLGYGESYLKTTIGYGPSASHKYVTTYFTKGFYIRDPSQVTSIHADLLYDDGVVIYLNGQLLARYSMPAGESTPSTHALGHEAAGYEGHDWSAYKGLLSYGPNTIAVEVHQASDASSDLVFDLGLSLQTVPTRSIPRRALWSYWDRGGDLGTAWRAPAYADAAWPSGNAPLGYGETYLASTTSYGPNASQKILTTYFRKKLRIDDAAIVKRLAGDLMFDDGAVLYVNGRELLRFGMPAGTITASTLAFGHEADDAYTPFAVNVPPGLLVDGDNEVAVEVHQASASSSDLVFDLALRPLSDPMFTEDAQNPLLRPSRAEDGPTYWRRSSVDAPAVVHMPDGSWLMFFSGSSGYQNSGYSIGRATSPDGVSWTMDEAPVQGAGGYIESLTYDGTTLHLYTYDYRDAGVISVYTSTDGLSWTRRADATLDGAYSATVLLAGGQYEMWYMQRDDGASYAVSTDGLHWTRLGSTDLLPQTIVKDARGYRGWFSDEVDIATATSVDGRTWTRRGVSLSAGSREDWNYIIGAPYVVADGSVLHMWFSGYNYLTGEGIDIGHAASR